MSLVLEIEIKRNETSAVSSNWQLLKNVCLPGYFFTSYLFTFLLFGLRFRFYTTYTHFSLPERKIKEKRVNWNPRKCEGFVCVCVRWRRAHSSRRNWLMVDGSGEVLSVCVSPRLNYPVTLLSASVFLFPPSDGGAHLFDSESSLIFSYRKHSDRGT